MKRKTPITIKFKNYLKIFREMRAFDLLLVVLVMQYFAGIPAIFFAFFATFFFILLVERVFKLRIL